jgi:hypothetical protein
MISGRVQEPDLIDERWLAEIFFTDFEMIRGPRLLIRHFYIA